MTDITRREFLRRAAGGALAIGAGGTRFTSLAQTSVHTPLPRRPLGATGLDVSILGLGCATIGYGGHSLSEGARVVEACIDAGITYIDAASSYGDAEVKVGTVMRERRAEVVLATKVLARRADDAWTEINRSLERLCTDRVDVLQIHAVNSDADMERVFANDGSLAAARRAKEQGICSHVGITGHTRVSVILEALRRYPFETVLAPLSSTDALVDDFGPLLFPEAERRKVGVMAMKVLAAGAVTDRVRESIRYSISLPVSTAIVGMGTVEEVRQNAGIARGFTPMSAEEAEALREATRTRATTSIMWWKRT